MAKLVAASINLSKIDKQKMKKSKNGDLYYDITISVNDKENTYGQDVSIYEAQTKEQREAKADKKYIGSGKTFWTNEKKAEAIQQPETKTEDLTDLPF